ncbi:hypothetical protein PMG11_10441 [Penicillium brasilianum]|uniref:DUF3533 domain-containing protein n=1 Tax=Penicillium brasilianum TaxID=104259 RepID=A0A0F7U2K1_PENBI|nr:hypothetical protein PMG11_10441 [Penicillium brasilianum]
MALYPKHNERRLSLSEPGLRKSRFTFFRTAALFGLLLTLLFLSLFSYIFGSLYQQAGHTHNLNVAFVDYDGGGQIGTAIRQAYSDLREDNFPTLIEYSPLRYPNPAMLRSAICNTDYWGALYISMNASDRLASALSNSEFASSYNRSDVLIFIWNEARYPSIADSLAQGMEILSETARIAYTEPGSAGSHQFQTVNRSSFDSVAVYVDPWHLASINIQPTTQGSRLIYNTLVVILILIQQFFFLATINGLYVQFGLFGTIKARRIVIFRFLISAVYAMAGAICTSGAIWAFRAGWKVNGNQWVLTSLTLWLFGHLNFLTLDVFAVWLPPAFLPMGLTTYLVLNVTSILLPFELSPAFYRWGNALPAHACYNILVDIWSGGCNPHLGYAFPVLFAYELCSGILSGLGVYRRAHYAVVTIEREESTWQERTDKAIEEFTRMPAPPMEGKLSQGMDIDVVQPNGVVNEELNREALAGREALVGELRRATSQMARGQETLRRKESLGPSFTLV